MNRTTSLAACLLFALLPHMARADDAARHVRGRTEMLFDQAAEAETDRLVERAGLYHKRDKQLPGTPIVIIAIREEIDDELFKALARLPRLRWVAITSPTSNDLKRLFQFRQLDTLEIVGAKLETSEMKALAAMPSLRTLRLHACEVVDADALKELAGAARLQTLDFVGCRGVTNEGIKDLSRLKSLQTLGLPSTAVTEEVMAELAGWPNLRSLSLSSTDITNKGLQQLARSKSLTELTLCCTKVGDTGLEALAPLVTLRRLDLTRCEKLTADGVQKLKTALPDCKIVGP